MPFAAGGVVPPPRGGSEVTPAGHRSVRPHVTPPPRGPAGSLVINYVPAVQIPTGQVAPQPVPHGVPLALFGFEHVPFAGLQTAS